MSILDPKPQTAAGLDAAVTAKINDTNSASRAALNATYAPKGEGLDAKVPAIAYDSGRRALAAVNGMLAETGEPVTVATPVASTTATTIASGVEVNAWDVPNARINSSIRTLRATPAQDAASWPRENWVRSKSTLTNSLTPTYLPASAPVFEFDYTGGKIDLLIRQGAASGVDAQADIFVDGKLAYAFTEAIAAATGAGSGSLIRIPITFASTRKRRIAVDFKATGTFAGWVRESTATSSYPDTGTKGPMVLLVGDSFGEGGSALPSGRPFIQWLAKMVGWSDVHNVSAGSTGYYTAGTRVALKDRYQHDVIDQAPNIILYALGINDLDNYIANPNNVLNAAALAWDAGITALPEAEHVIIGPFFPRGGTGLPAAMVTMDADLKTRATARGLRYISPISEAWITGTGHVGNLKGDGNADTYISSDGTHPTPAGHKYLAWRIAGHLLTPAGAV